MTYVELVMVQIYMQSSASNNWRQDAACKGHNVEHLRPRTCWGCPVRWVCLYEALAIDDRAHSDLGAMWLRGGISATIRERQWRYTQHDVDDAFARCKAIGLEDEANNRFTFSKGK
jgi:hypothetical protein